MLMWFSSANLMSNGGFVGSKARQHWIWFAYNTQTGGVVAYTFGFTKCGPFLARIFRFRQQLSQFFSI